MNIMRNFYKEIKSLKFKPITYTLYNMIEDDHFVEKLNKMDKTKYSIDDFVYAFFDLNDKEKFLLQQWNGEYMKNIKELKSKLENKEKCMVYVNHEYGMIVIVKLKTVTINGEFNDCEEKNDKTDI